MLTAHPTAEQTVPGAVGPEQAAAHDIRLAYGIFVLSAAAVGTFVRVVSVSKADFPLGDGGLFYVMVRDLARHGWMLPTTTSYNGQGIPFAYPPLAFYFAGFLHAGLHLDLLEILRWFPLAMSCLSIGAYALLAWEIAPLPVAVASVFTFAILPDSFDLEIDGGGLTRAPGELFAILALWQLSRLFRIPSLRSLFGATVFAALTILTHPEWTQFTAVTACVFLLCLDRTLRGVRNLALVAAGAAVISAPWWIRVVLIHGPAPFAAAVTSSGGNAQGFPLQHNLGPIFGLTLTHELWLPAASALAVLGLVYTCATRSWLLPAWLAALLVTDARSWALISVPVSLLAGTGIVRVLVPLLAGARAPGELRPQDITRLQTWIIAGCLTFLLVRGLFSSVVFEQDANAALSPGQRGAMAWVAAHLPPGSRFLIFASSQASDEPEWFPALSRSRSLVTLQGLEWIPGASQRAYLTLQTLARCGNSAGCVLATSRSRGLNVQYVYLGWPPGMTECEGLCRSFLRLRSARLIYRGNRVWIFRVSPTTLASATQ